MSAGMQADHAIAQPPETIRLIPASRRIALVANTSRTSTGGTSRREQYVLLDDVCAAAGLDSARLLDTYPGLRRQLASSDERDLLISAGIISDGNINAVLVNATDADALLSGDVDAAFSVLPIAKSIRRTRAATGWHLNAPAPPTVSEVQKRTTKRRKKYYGVRLCWDTDAQAEVKEDDALIPVRVDVDTDGHKVRDTFTWNKNEHLMTTERFAEQFCDDLNVPATVVHAVDSAIKSQLQKFAPYVGSEDFGDCRVAIKIDLNVGDTNLIDQFEWDINSPSNDPEEFAIRTCAELGLAGEFVPAIAHSVREQLQWYARSLIVGRTGRGEIAAEPLPPVDAPFREANEADNWSPRIELLDDQDIQKKVQSQERNARRIRRQQNVGPQDVVGWSSTPLPSTYTSNIVRPPMKAHVPVKMLRNKEKSTTSKRPKRSGR